MQDRQTDTDIEVKCGDIAVPGTPVLYCTSAGQKKSIFLPVKHNNDFKARLRRRHNTLNSVEILKFKLLNGTVSKSKTILSANSEQVQS